MKKILHQMRLRVSLYLYHKSYSWLSASATYLNQGLHPKHTLTNYHDFFLKNITKNNHVLDIGCGKGFLANDLAKKAKQVTAIDLEKANISKAKKLYCRKNLTFSQADALKSNFRSYDVVVLSNVLEHIVARKSLLKKIRKITPKLLLRVPLITRSWVPLYLKQQGFEYRLDQTHQIEYTEKQIIQELTAAGFQIKDSYSRFGEYYAICQ